MGEIISKNPLVEKVCNGSASADLISMLLQHELPLTEEEYLESLVFMLKRDEFKEQAHKLLQQISSGVKENYVSKKDAHHRVVFYLLEETIASDQQTILTRIIHNNMLPVEFLMRIAAGSSEATLEILLENQIRLVAYPEILDIIEKNPQVNNFLLGKIKEIRDFYLRAEAAEQIPAEMALSADVLKLAEQEEEGTAEASEEKTQNVKKRALTNLQVINSMNISDRMKLALTGNRMDRMILIKDPNKMVQLSVVTSPKIMDDEVLLITRDRSLAGEVIDKIAQNRDWTKNYAIALSLVQNPKTSISKATSFIKQLHTKDLRTVAQDRNINPSVRILAMNYLKEKERVSSK